MTMLDTFPPTRQAALARVSDLRPSDCARSRNALEGAVTGLSPYITHGLISLPEVLDGVTAKHPLDMQHKFVFELGWREYFRHVWAFRGEEIFESLREGLLPQTSYSALMPADIREPPSDLGWSQPDSAAVAGREVWLVHPWNLGDLPTTLPANTVVVGVFVNDFHRAWPWSERRWRFVASRMAQLTALRWQGDATVIGAALHGATRVRSVDEPHLAPWLASLAVCEAAVELFPAVDRRCDSFSQWWTRASRSFATASDLLAARQMPAW